LIGSGEPLQLLTGLGAAMENWVSEFIEEASKKYQLILMDNRGMGYSTDNGQQFTSCCWSERRIVEVCTDFVTGAFNGSIRYEDFYN
jgi:pimeloyl-ACP methyl ester carboxylesterase